MEHFTSFTSEISLLGIIFLVAFFTGRVAQKLKIPKVTAYILVGILFGPSLFNFLTEEMAHQHETFNEVAFGLILFNIGGEFHKGLFKNLELKHIYHSTIMAFLILIITALISYLFSLTTNMDLGQRVAYSITLGTIAIAAAPPTTLLVVKELDAEGPLTHLTMVFFSNWNYNNPYPLSSLRHCFLLKRAFGVAQRFPFLLNFSISF
jgi:Kef-type K+ transport system membrane component KefB